jgi:cytoskeletal protein CcmA (bactofilin family)
MVQVLILMPKILEPEVLHFLIKRHLLPIVELLQLTTVPVSNTYVAITKRFPLGSYIQIDEEIMRVASSTLTTPSVGNVGITVIRGVLATKQVSHDSGSLVRKIKPIPIEFRRPSIVRASGHTFEYLGYGPGNYSTALPQVQSITLTEREEFLVQSQERSGGIVVYTGMNNNGDSFIGNRKTSSATGEEITFDNPIPTVTGEDPSRLSAIFDEVTVKERLVVEGGNSGAVLSQFDGPVTFNKEVKFNDSVNIKTQLKLSDTTQSTSIANGALVVSGGVGIAKNLNVGGNLNVTGNIIGNITGNTSGNVTGDLTGTATNATNINISATTSSDTTTSVVLVANQSTGNQSPFIDSGLSYNADTNALTASTFSGALSGNASSATQLQTSKTFTITGVVDAPAVSFDGTDNVNLVTTLDDNSITTNKIANSSVTTAKINFQSSLVPAGSVFYMAASSADTATGGSVTISAVTYHAPEGYLICNGGTIPTSGTFQGVSASLLQNLRNFLGGTYGAAGRLPDLINNFAGYSAVPGQLVVVRMPLWFLIVILELQLLMRVLGTVTDIPQVMTKM